MGTKPSEVKWGVAKGVKCGDMDWEIVCGGEFNTRATVSTVSPET